MTVAREHDNAIGKLQAAMSVANQVAMQHHAGLICEERKFDLRVYLETATAALNAAIVLLAEEAGKHGC
jgi:hypothetical protein